MKDLSHLLEQASYFLLGPLIVQIYHYESIKKCRLVEESETNIRQNHYKIDYMKYSLEILSEFHPQEQNIIIRNCIFH